MLSGIYQCTVCQLVTDGNTEELMTKEHFSPQNMAILGILREATRQPSVQARMVSPAPEPAPVPSCGVLQSTSMTE